MCVCVGVCACVRVGCRALGVVSPAPLRAPCVHAAAARARAATARRSCPSAHAQIQEKEGRGDRPKRRLR
eukprot:785386-Pleurochrysis_carterae.AAC.1